MCFAISKDAYDESSDDSNVPSTIIQTSLVPLHYHLSFKLIERETTDAAFLACDKGRKAATQGEPQLGS